MSTQIAADGEKIPPELLHQVHVQHPGAPDRFARSTLLVGSRGVGKTLLLRHRRHSHHQEAAYVNLQSILGSLHNEGIGSYAEDLNLNWTLGVQSKTRALVAATTLEDVIDRLGPNSKAKLLKKLLELRPRNVRLSRSVGSPLQLFDEFASIDINSWSNDNAASFQAFLELLNTELGYEFSLFLDRVDDAPRAAAQALLPLLSQTVPFISVLAGRVGATQIVPSVQNPTLAPGDHYDVLHLGYSIDTEAWASFMREGINRFLESNELESLPDKNGDWALRLARESLRNAIAHVQTLMTYPVLADRVLAVADQRRFVLNTARQAIGKSHDDFNALVSYLNRQGSNHDCGPTDRLLVRIVDEDGDALIAVPDRDKIHSFMLAALRTEAIFLPNGQRWHPHWLPNEFELAPILAWNGRDSAWVA